MATTHKALVLHSTSRPLSLETLPIPTATPGSVIVKILGCAILPYLKDILNGTLPYAITFPMIPGSNCVARVHSVGPDSVSLTEGQLVLCDITVRARDDPNKAILIGIHGGAAMGLMEGEWRHGTFAEYAKFPLENVFLLNEDILLGKFGYTIEDLCATSNFLVPYGGLEEIGLKPGDTIIVAPATGKFGGGAVTMALAMGAKVIACGRNASMLSNMAEVFKETERLGTYVVTGDVETDTAALTKLANNGAGADAYIDFSPPSAAKSTHIQSCLSALRIKGTACLMGGIPSNIEINYQLVMMKSLRIQGKFMYEREMIVQAIKMIENGNLKLGENVGSKTVRRFGLEGIEEGLVEAGKETGWGKQVLLMP
ncbi:isopropanol dehydrogenase [Acephala macrosclerotiorum]|nr:isopropanol dehydrogenase [Acephala macrosclerotiorum]